MAASTAVRAFGTVVQLESSPGSGIYASTFENVEVNTPAPSRAEIDVTHHESPGDYEEFIGSFKNAGTMDFTCNWNPANAQHQRLFDLFESGTIVNWRISYPVSGASSTFAAYVAQKPQQMAPLKDALRIKTGLRLTGPITELP